MKRRKKISRSKKAKIYRRRRIIALSIVLLLIFSISFIIRKVYLTIKCKDLNYSVNYNLTSNPSDEINLLRVQNFSLIFSDTDLVIVKASGLRKEKPHKQLTIEGRFAKNSFGTWELEKSNLIEKE